MSEVLSSAPDRRRILLHRRVADIRPGRIDLRPSPEAMVGPLIGVGIGAAAFAAIIVLRGTLPVLALAMLLLLAVVLIPFAGMGLIYALYGTNIIFDGRKGTATFQQGVIGLGIGTVELVPFAKIAQFVVEEAGEDDADPLPTEELTQWQLTLVKVSGKRRRIGGMVMLRSFEMAALGPVIELGRALAEFTDKPLVLPEIEENQDEGA
ncbi:MAG: hypothetical protein EXR43_04050 [Dehalococcoidia bacterium]|nr:hypothetical protein [Dehalococcoidia bacterium]